MQFKQYRPKGIIEAAMIERDMILPDGTGVIKGDYFLLNEQGQAKHVTKAEFESIYEPYRQRAAKSPAKNGSKVKKAKAVAVSEPA